MNKELTVKEQEKLQNLLVLADQVILQTHYSQMDLQALCPIDQRIAQIRADDITCLYRITELVCDRKAGCTKALTTVLNAMHSASATCIMLLQCVEGRSELYLGAVNKKNCDNYYYLTTIQNVLRTALEGNLPGTEFQEITSRQDVDKKLRECLDSGFDTQCITSVSCVAEQPEQGHLRDGLEKLLSAVGPKNFTIMILADPVDRQEIAVTRQGYENLGTRLSEFETMNVSMQKSKGTSSTVSETIGLSKSITDSISHTQNTSYSNGWSNGASHNQNNKNIVKGVVSGGVGVISAVAAKNPQAGFMAMNVVSGLMGKDSSDGTNEGTNGGETHGTADQQGQAIQSGQNQQKTSGQTDNISESMTIQFTQKDCHIQSLLGKLNAYLKWLDRRENYGMFDCCAYIISGNPGTNMLVASQYQALMQGDGEMSQPITMNTWTEGAGLEQVRESLLHMSHPIIQREGVRFSPAMLTSSKELACQMALPRESVVGVTVMEYEAFGREVVRKSPLPDGRVIRLGNINHMGKVDKTQPVLLDVQSLASHTFIAGTNGSGKSNTVFCLLEELVKADIPFLVVEPAKGEYKNVFGQEQNVHVYGTNRKKTPLLHLNPFWFNEDVDIKEHIASLMGIFTASWSMYAAMSQVLNAAIENAYRACGWNITTSRCAKQRIFPTVADVMEALQGKMEQTAFSDEVRGNYVGALSTRLEALNTGICADIFSGADLGDEALFASNVLIDLSRTGSSEISAMVMGILLVRLQEYRKSEGAINHPLRHITVLEEAHHLLRKTSSVQSEDSANPMGKAVEMISNAIAEMRSYGDGFIIADQSPGLLDESVLRNTNTKIVMRLPDGNDRELMGRTIGLTDKQAFELSRLKTGVAIVYQKDWLEAVSCQVDRAKHKEILYDYQPKPDEENTRLLEIGCFLADSCMGDVNGSRKHIMEQVLHTAVSGKTRKSLLKLLGQQDAPWEVYAEVLCAMFPVSMEYPDSLHQEDMDLWYLETGLTNDLEDFPNNLCRLILAANAAKLGKTDTKWDAVSKYLYHNESDKLLKSARATVFAAVCGIPEKKPVGSLGILSNGSETDKKLWMLYQQFQETGVCRQRREIHPYSEIAWELCGGEMAWQSALPLLLKGDYRGWTDKMCQSLSDNLSGQQLTQLEVLSLALQNKGLRPEVKQFYIKWFVWAKSVSSPSKSETL